MESLIAPIIVNIRDPEFIGPTGIEVSFCSWECLAQWSNTQAGGPVPDFNSDFWPMEQWPWPTS
jgi:hypothetical protein